MRRTPSLAENEALDEGVNPFVLTVHKNPGETNASENEKFSRLPAPHSCGFRDPSVRSETNIHGCVAILTPESGS